MKRLLREPLLHFIVLGAGLFSLYAMVGEGAASDASRVVVSPGQIEHLATTYEQVWQRPPTSEELERLVEDHVESEILSREAMALRLHEDDSVIRMRLRQKMEFLTEDFASAREPSEEELAAYLDRHRDAYLERPRFTFRQVCIDSEARGDAEGDARALLGQLRESGPDANIMDLGDRVLLPTEFVDASWERVSSQLGSPFAKRLASADVGVWTGPLPSGYGLHLVFISERVEGATPDLADVRERVERDFLAARRRKVFDEFLNGLREKYTVIVEWPESADDDVLASGEGRS